MTRRTLALATSLLGLACSTAPEQSGVDAATPGADAFTPSIDGATHAADAAHVASATGIDQVFAGEYVTSFLHDGRVYSDGAAPLYRRGAGDHPPDHAYPPSEVDLPADVRIVAGAGGLHFTIIADTNGHVYEWGDIDANPDLANHNSPIRLTNADGSPFVLPGGVVAMSASVGTSGAVAGDGSVWIWDDCENNFCGDGVDHSNAMNTPWPMLHPFRVPLPSDVHATHIILGDTVIILDDMGRIWTWGGDADEDLGTGSHDHLSPHPITTTKTGSAMPPVREIASGGPYSYAITTSGDLYVWGIYLEIAGHCPGSGWCPEAHPALSNDVIAPATTGGARLVHIRASSGGSYAIMSDGTLWGWGTNGQGLVGDGHETDRSVAATAAGQTPYTWDWNKDAMLVTSAVHIAPDVHDFVDLFSGTALVFYAYALTSDGHLYSWGRNKTGCLGSGRLPTNSQQAATYPNSWDVTTPTSVDPMRATDMPVSSPACTMASSPSCWCAGGMSGPQNC